MTLIFATHNPNKVREIRAVLGNHLHIISLQEAGILEEIPEPHASLEANAREKSETIYRLTGSHCFSEDTGLEVEALQGAPGVKSARFAGPEQDSGKNIQLLLEKMTGIENRAARFRTVISLILDGREYQFEGICNGEIAETPSGSEGFGYDPVFIPDGATVSFAEMTLEEKNRYSHRKKATAQLAEFLKSYYGKDKNTD